MASAAPCPPWEKEPGFPPEVTTVKFPDIPIGVERIIYLL